MSKLVQPILTVIIGIMAGIYLYQEFGPQARQQTDSPLVDSVYSAQAQSTGLATNRSNAITEAVKKVRPAVVSINVLKVNKYIQRSPFGNDPFFKNFFPELFGDRIIEKPAQSIGSGFIISEDGYVVTNNHVAGNAEEILVIMGDGTQLPAQLIGSDHVADISLLKLDKKNLPIVKFGDSDNMLIGEWAIALGNPFGLFVNNSPTVTVGVISAVNRDFSPIEGRVYEDMLQTDAAINPGNSGGPLCNAAGEVVGMNTFIYTGSSGSSGSVGVGFAIPSNYIKQVIEKLKKRGKGDSEFWTGLSAIDITPYIANMIHYNSTQGVLIKGIEKNSPAENAGIELGDVILSLNGIDISNSQSVRYVLNSLELLVGDKLKVKIWRDGKILEKVIVLEKYPH